VQEAEALEKPGRPTFFERPAWSFNMGWEFLLVNGWWWLCGGRCRSRRLTERLTDYTLFVVFGRVRVRKHACTRLMGSLMGWGSRVTPAKCSK